MVLQYGVSAMHIKVECNHDMDASTNIATNTMVA
jgi:hypothetical protein